MKPLIRETEDKKYFEVIGHYDNPILCAKLTAIADLFAVEKKEGYAKFRIEDESKLAVIDDGLKFISIDFYVMNNSFYTIGGNTWQQFINEGVYTEFSIDGNYVLYKGHKIIDDNGDYVAPNVSISEDEYYYIDLAGTKWVIDDAPDLQYIAEEDSPVGFNLNYSSNNQTFAGIAFEYDIGSDAGDGNVQEQGIYYGSNKVYDGYTETWYNVAHKTIEITGGDDATNTTLVEWFDQNATLQEEPQPIVPQPSSFKSIKLNGNVFTVNGTDYTLDGTSEVVDANESSFKGISAVDNGNGTITLTVGSNSITVNKPHSAFNNIRIHNAGDGYLYYSLNGGNEVRIDEYQSVTLNNVTSLTIRIESPYTNVPLLIGTQDGSEDIALIPHRSGAIDVTSYLIDGCYIYCATEW